MNEIRRSPDEYNRLSQGSINRALPLYFVEPLYSEGLAALGFVRLSY